MGVALSIPFGGAAFPHNNNWRLFMRTETKIITIPVYTEVDGEFIKTDETREVTLTDIYADEGKTFIHIPTNRIAGTHITLGTNDSEENYYETDL
jgi:hypothetical protein